jgi:hypothetical protein
VTCPTTSLCTGILLSLPTLSGPTSVNTISQPYVHTKPASPTVLLTLRSQIFTFDSHGISGHPNHGSLVVGLSQLLLDWPHDAKKPKPRLFTLTSVSLGSKYIGLLSPLTRRISLPLERLWGRIWRRGRSQPPPLVVISGLKEYLTAHKAMRQHASQLVWFRHLYVLFSRYMWVNDWQEVDVNLGNGKVHNTNNKDNTDTDTDTNKINNVKGGGIMPDSEVETRAEDEDEAAKDVDSQETQAE